MFIQISQQPSLLLLHFPPQHVLEKALPWNPGVAKPLPLPAQFSGPTRLSFAIPVALNGTSLGDSFDELMNFIATLAPNVVDCAQPPGGPTDGSLPEPVIGSVDPLKTSIELPFGLFLSPDQQERWLASSHPRNGVRNELWSLNLATIGDRQNEKPTIRAVSVGSNIVDPASILGGDSYAILPDQQDRPMIVQQTSNFNLKQSDGLTKYFPKPVTADHLMLTAVGAYARLRVKWDLDEMRKMPLSAPTLNDPPKPGDPPVSLDLNDWIQETNWGRDQFVKVSKMGYVLPFGHPVAYIQIHRREFDDASSPDGITGADGAFLFHRAYYQVLQADMTYQQVMDGVNTVGRSHCFQKVTLDPLVTPFVND